MRCPELVEFQSTILNMAFTMENSKKLLLSLLLKVKSEPVRSLNFIMA